MTATRLLLLLACIAPPGRCTAQQGPPYAGLEAGLAVRDITPPPGLGLGGYGPEGRRAEGWRLRLQARAAVIRSGTEVIALVQVDLPHVSALLHRAVVARLAGTLGLTADRVVLVATHTHAGPSHMHDSRAFNQWSSSVAGFDTMLVAGMAARVADAITAAAEAAEPVGISIAQVPVWGATRIRSLPAFLRNNPAYRPPDGAPAGLAPAEASVNPMLTLLLFERLDRTRPGFAGALAHFAVHGTGNATVNTLYDGDVPGRLARAVDSVMRADPAHRSDPDPVTVMLSGPMGDVSPTWSMPSRCEPPRAAPERQDMGLRQVTAQEWLEPPPATSASCRAAALGDLSRIADMLAVGAGEAVRSRGALSPEARVASAFHVAALVGPEAPEGLCSDPTPGTATLGGSPDARSRYNGQRLLGFIDLGLEEGAAAQRRPPSGCHGAKRTGLTRMLSGITVGGSGYPQNAQLSLIRIGPLVIAALPFEVSTTSGARIARHACDAMTGCDSLTIVVVSHANGYAQYLTTSEEYAEQHYEGSSTLFGPHQAEAITHLVVAMVPDLDSARRVDVPAWTSQPGRRRAVIGWKAPGSAGVTRATLRCAGDTAVATWRAAPPVARWPADGAVIRFENQEGRAWHDGDHGVEVRVGPGSRPRWEARLHPAPATAVRATILEAGVSLGPVSCSR